MRTKFMYVLLAVLVGISCIMLFQQSLVKEETTFGSRFGTLPFVAWAQESEEKAVARVNFLEEEAGIAAYVKIDQVIDIAHLRDTFNVVEQLEDTYLTGQIAIPELNENWQPHLFVTRDGWIVAYHSRHEPTSIMLTKWITREDTTLTGTTLELAIRETLRSTGISSSGIMQQLKYHHFQYPAADRIMLIREDEKHANRDDFYLTIPAGLGILDASWIAYDCVNGWEGMRIDGQGIIEKFDGIRFGDLLPHLQPGTRHTISVWGGNYGIVLLYEAP